MGFSEWQCELELCIRYEFNVVHLNFQNFINAQQAQERKYICCLEQPACSATTPGVDVLSFPLSEELNRLELPMLRLVIEIIDFLQNLL